jgi:hypothetical protein
MRQAYKDINFRDGAFDMLKLVNHIVTDFSKAGYRLEGQ